MQRRAALKTLLTLLAIPNAYHVNYSVADGLPNVTGHVTFLIQSASDYAEHVTIFNKRITRRPKLIAVCLTSKGVQLAIQYANQQNLSVGVKSGGHGFEGFALNADGLMLDLSLMKTLQYDVSSKIFTTQPGAKLGKVYEYLAQYERLIPAGSCAGVGVAGLTLGGGYGFFSRQYGLTCDSLRRVQLVDGQGKLHDSRDEPDLLWACRGGNNGSLGIVTELQFDTHPAPKTFTKYRYKYNKLSLDQASALTERWFNMMRQLPLTCYSSWVLGPGHLTILLTDTAAQPSRTLHAILKRLRFDASSVSKVETLPFLAGVQSIRAGIEPMYFHNVSAGYYQGFKDFASQFPTIFELMNTSPLKQNLLQINTMGGAIQTIDSKTAAYPHRQYAFLGEFQVYYQQAKDTKPAGELVRQVQSTFAKAGVKAHYANYPDVGLDHWQQAYYGDNYPRLLSIKRQLDPSNRIQHAQSIG